MTNNYSAPAVFDRGSVVGETLGHAIVSTLESGAMSNQWAIAKTSAANETSSEGMTNPEIGGSYD